MYTESFDGAKSTHSARRGARRNLVGWASAGTTPRNDADGLIWPTEGRLFALPGLRYVSFVVDHTTARDVPGYKTR